jgi:PAS domain S-box-containing protein
MSRAKRLWLTVAPAAVVTAGILCAVLLTSDHQELPVLSVVLGGLTGLSFIAAGLIARTRRPLNRTGLLLIAVGFAWFAAGLTAANGSLVWTLGVAISAVFAAFLVHLLLAYPSGELTSRWDRVVVAIGYCLAASANVLLLLFDPRPVDDCEECPENALLVRENETTADVLTAAVEAFAAVFLLGVVATLVRRWRRSTPAARRALAPVLLAGAATLFFLGISVGIQEFWPTAAEILGWIASVAFMTVPFLFLWGLLQSRLARAGLGPLMREHYTLAELHREIRRILRDPTANLVIWLEGRNGYIDAEGRPYEPPAESSDRAVTEIEDEEGRLGALVHDPALRDEALLGDVAGALRMNLQHLRSTAALEASERRSRALLEALPDNMYRISREGVYLDVHAQDPTQLRLPVDQFIGSTVWDYPVPHRTTEELMATAERAFETGSVQTFEFEARLEDGTARYREGRVAPSGPDEFLLITRDITDRKRAEQELRSSEQRSRALLEALPDNMFRVSRDGTFLDYHANEATPLMDPEAIVGANVYDYPVPRELVERIMAAAETAFETRTRQTVEYQLDDENGVRYQEARITPSGQNEFFIIVRDVTDRKRSEQALEISEQRSRALLEAIPDSMFRISCAGRILDYRVEPPIQLFHSEEDIIGSDVYDADFPREISERTMALGRKAVETGELQMHEYALEIDGRLHHQEARISRSGVDEFLVILRDVTERKRREEELRTSEQRSRALLEAIPDLMFRCSRDGTFLDVHEGERRSLRPVDEIVGMNVYDYPIPRELMDRFMAAAETGFETGTNQTFEYELELKGEVRHQEARLAPIGDDEFFVMIRDVTEARRQEKQLERERDFVATVVNTAPSYFAVIDLEGRIVRFNRTLELASGYPDDDATRGKPFWDVFFLPDEHDEGRKAVREMKDAAGSEPRESTWRTRDGESRRVAWSLTPLVDAEGTPRYLLTALDVTELRQEELISRHRRELVSTIAEITFGLHPIVDSEGRLHPGGFNRAFIETTGWTSENAAGRVFWDDIVPPEEADRMRSALEEVFSGAPPRRHESEWLTRDGRRISVEWEARPITDPEGKRLYVISGIDVTSRKAKEEEEAALRRVAVAVASERLPEQIFAVVTEEIGGLFRAHTANLVRFEPGGKEIVIVGRWSTPGVHSYELGMRIPLVGGPITMVKETEAPVRMDVQSAPPDWAEQLRKLGVNSVVAAPISVSGRPWGAVSASLTPPNAFPPGSEHRLAQFTRLVSLALANAEARAQLAAQRARIVHAGDEERRRLERNLHDGAQQRLVSLSLSLRLAQTKLASDPHAADELLSSASIELALALEELRELARGIHPAVLTERGLGPALESLADRAPLPVELKQLPSERLPGQVEAAAYYVVSEALTNVAKYAEASAVSVRIAQENGRAVVEVVDDGVGGADPARGSGLRGLTDRVEALEGRFALDSRPGGGTKIRAEIPCA